MKINANLTISRNSGDTMRLTLMDENSRIRFAKVGISPHDLMMALTGLAHIDVECEVHGLEHVGKVKVIERRSVTYPGVSYDRKLLEAWLRDQCQEEGWTIDPYLGGQQSTKVEGHKTILNYSVFKYVEPSHEQSDTQAAA